MKSRIKKTFFILLNVIVISTLLGSTTHATSDSPKKEKETVVPLNEGVDKLVILKSIEEQLQYAASHTNPGTGFIIDLTKIEVELTEVKDTKNIKDGKFVIPVFQLGKTNTIDMEGSWVDRFSFER